MRRLRVLTVLALGASVAQADSGMFYFGAGVTRNHIDEARYAIFPATNSTSWEVFAGIRPIHLFAVEANYFDFGSQTTEGFFVPTQESDARAFAVYAVGFLPIPLSYLDVYGKAGVAHYNWYGKITYANCCYFSYSENPTVFTLGRGLTGAHWHHRWPAGIRGLQ